MIGLKELQQEIKPWVAHNFGNRESWQPLVGLMEELGELSHSHLKMEQGIRVGENHEEKAKDAVGDIMIYLMDYCNTKGYDLETCIVRAWNEVKFRDWVKFPKNGRTE